MIMQLTDYAGYKPLTNSKCVTRIDKNKQEETAYKTTNLGEEIASTFQPSQHQTHRVCTSTWNIEP